MVENSRTLCWCSYCTVVTRSEVSSPFFSLDLSQSRVGGRLDKQEIYNGREEEEKNVGSRAL